MAAHAPPRLENETDFDVRNSIPDRVNHWGQPGRSDTGCLQSGDTTDYGHRQCGRESRTGGRQDFVESLLNDLRALQQMLDQGVIESSPQRIGVEQEFFLVDQNWQPAPVAPQILEASEDPHLPPELGRFNLEFNCDPLQFRGDCLGKLERQLNQSIENVATLSEHYGARVLLTGILPTLTMSQFNRRISFEQVKSNFLVAARSGLDEQVSWLDGKILPAAELIQRHLLPLAREGLRHRGVDARDIDR